MDCFEFIMLFNRHYICLTLYATVIVLLRVKSRLFSNWYELWQHTITPIRYNLHIFLI